LIEREVQRLAVLVNHFDTTKPPIDHSTTRLKATPSA
jgi:hypothetical protein